MTDRPVVLLVCRTYLPGFKAGGPVRTLANMVAALGDEFDFRIVTLDRDFRSATAYPDIAPGQWAPVGKAQVLYLDPKSVSLAALRKIVTTTAPDVLYLNSLMDTVFPARLLLLRRLGLIAVARVVLAVRGQLNPGALGLRSRAKRAYLATLRRSGMLDGLIWQASGAPEARAIDACFDSRFFAASGGSVSVAPDIAYAEGNASDDWQPRASGAPLRIALLGRVSRMKNIDVAIAALAGMTHAATLDIIGPIEDEAYWRDCGKAIAALPSGRTARALGAIAPEVVPATLARYDCFLLPSRGENFGHAIAEALNAGLPLVISDRTPWCDLAAQGIGWDLSLDDIAEFSARLDQLARLDGEAMRERHETCARHAKTALTDARILQANRQLFHGDSNPEFP